MMTDIERRLMEMNGLTESDMQKQPNSNDANAELAELREALLAYIRGDLE